MLVNCGHWEVKIIDNFNSDQDGLIRYELLQIWLIFIQVFREMLDLDEVQTKSCSKKDGTRGLG